MAAKHVEPRQLGPLHVEDKQFPTTTLNKVRAKLSRIERELKQHRKLFENLQQDRRRFHAELEDAQTSVINSRDDENELIVRFVEAKLHSERLADKKAEAEREIREIRQNTHEMETAYTSVDGELATRLTLQIQKETEVKQLRRSTGDMEKKCHQWEGQVKSSKEAVSQGREAVQKEQEDLKFMEARYQLMRQAIENALQPVAEEGTRH